MPTMQDVYKKSVAKKVVANWYQLAGKYAANYKFDPTTVLAIICQESTGDPDAQNPSDPSKGLMQITPGALSDFNKAIGRSYTFDDMFVPYKNIEVGTWYIVSRYNKTNDMTQALAAYNAGLGNISAGLGYADKVKSYVPYIQTEMQTQGV
jgi:soluble lytic murein transglycosylase